MAKQIHGVPASQYLAKRARRARRIAATARAAQGAQTWKRAASAKIARLSPVEARDLLAKINAETSAAGGPTIFHATIRDLTGGYNSQSINFFVIRKLFDRSREVA